MPFPKGDVFSKYSFLGGVVIIWGGLVTVVILALWDGYKPSF
jgi:hypothetical protein